MNQKASRARRHQRGAVLLFAIGTLAGLVAIVAIVASSQQIMARARINRLNKLNARTMAESGIQLALATLSQQSPTATTQNDQWNQLGGSPDQPGSMEYNVAGGSFRVQVIDANSLIDINTVTLPQLQLLPLTTAQIDCLLDWRETGTTARADGAKDDFYSSLTNPYLTRLGRFYSVQDLLLVDNFVPQTLYDTGQDIGSSVSLTAGDSNQQPVLASLLTTDSLSPNLNPQGQAKLNVNSQSLTANLIEQKGIPAPIANLIASRKPITSLSQLMQIPGVSGQFAQTILDELGTQTGTQAEGLIDLNTAGLSVLNTVPGMTSDVAQAIVNQQTTGFTSLSQLLSLTAGSPSQLQNLLDYFCVASNTFIVRVEGTYGTTHCDLQAVVQLSTDGKPQLYSLEETPFPNMPVRWGWYTVTNNTVVVDPSQVNANP